MNITDFINHLKTIESRVLSDSNQQLSGHELAKRVLEFSESLARSDIGSGSPVLVRMNNSVESVVCFLGAVKAGAIVFVGNPYDPIDRVVQLVKQFGIGAVFGDKATAMTIQAKLVDTYQETLLHSYFDGQLFAYNVKQNAHPLVNESDSLKCAQVAIFSSGTTGQPKAILHSFESLICNAQGHANAVGLKSTDVVAGFLPIYYSYGLVANLLSSLFTGSQFVFQSRSANLNEQWAVENRISVLALTPFFGQTLNVSIPSLRLITFGGDALGTEAAEELQKKFQGCELYSTYGLTEAGPRVATWRFDNKKIPAGLIVPLGEALPHCSISLQFEGHQHVGLGELVVTTSTKTLGYYYGPKSRGQKGYVIPDWPINEVHTGDLFFDIDGEYYFASRDKEMIVQNGEKIFPPMIESVIRSMPQVKDVRVEGKKDSVKGQIAVAYIEVNESVDAKAVRRFMLQHLPHAVVPSDFVFVEKISRSQTGKKIKQESNEIQDDTTDIKLVNSGVALSDQNSLDNKVVVDTSSHDIAIA